MSKHQEDVPRKDTISGAEAEDMIKGLEGAEVVVAYQDGMGRESRKKVSREKLAEYWHKALEDTDNPWDGKYLLDSDLPQESEFPQAGDLKGEDGIDTEVALVEEEDGSYALSVTLEYTAPGVEGAQLTVYLGEKSDYLQERR